MLCNKLYDTPTANCAAETPRTSAARDSGASPEFDSSRLTDSGSVPAYNMEKESDNIVPNNYDKEMLRKIIERSTYGMHVDKHADKRKDFGHDI